jgi:hypothetical protein
MSHVHMPEGWKFIGAGLSQDEPLESMGCSSTDDAIAAMDDVCRRMDVLAKELGCLGYFSDDCPEGPKAA